jgi:hypothetical protein
MSVIDQLIEINSTIMVFVDNGEDLIHLIILLQQLFHLIAVQLSITIHVGPSELQSFLSRREFAPLTGEAS